MRDGTMLEVLERAESVLPKLLYSLDGWVSLDVDYHPPRVERLWRPFEDAYRLYLHRIHPCEEPLYHPHPWMSAIRIVSGKQEMCVGTANHVLATVVLTAGSYYEMVRVNGWHSVKPIRDPSLSVMVTAEPYPEPVREFDVRPSRPLSPLSKESSEGLFKDFCRVYGV